ncbi:hypothetical protein MAQ58_23485, partial [Enterobacter sp. DRP3]|nr:hypothetical protein [Enterobacter sp. DRP3]
LPTFGSKWLLPHLHGFYAAHPGVTVHLHSRIGALDFLEKPIALQKLLKSVEHGLARGAAPGNAVARWLAVKPVSSALTTASATPSPATRVVLKIPVAMPARSTGTTL